MVIIGLSVGYSLIRRSPDDPTVWIPNDTVTIIRWAVGVFFMLLCPLTFSRNQSSTDITLSITGIAVFLAGAVFFFGAKSPLSSIFQKEVEGILALNPRGFYRMLRHPIFFGYFLLAFGYAITLVSLPGIIVSVAVILPLMVYSAARVDQYWARRGGNSYAIYSERVPLFFPASPRRK
ncbi:MAG: DUF1295 domain-containing protein [Methanomassiliicoccales archaeon]